MASNSQLSNTNMGPLKAWTNSSENRGILLEEIPESPEAMLIETRTVLCLGRKETEEESTTIRDGSTLHLGWKDEWKPDMHDELEEELTGLMGFYEQTNPSNDQERENLSEHINEVASFEEELKRLEHLAEDLGKDKEKENPNTDDQPTAHMVQELKRKAQDKGKSSEEGERRKRKLRKQFEPTRFEATPCRNSSNEEVEIISTKAGRTMKRTRSTTAAEKAKRGLIDEPTDEEREFLNVDLEELERKAESSKKRKVQMGDTPRSRPGEVPSDTPRDSRKSGGKLRLDESRARINNKRIAKNVPDVSNEGLNFDSEDQLAKWKYVCARNVLAERYLAESTKSIRTYMQILKEVGVLPMLGGI